MMIIVTDAKNMPIKTTMATVTAMVVRVALFFHHGFLFDFLNLL